MFTAAHYLAAHAERLKETGTTIVFRPDSGAIHAVLPQLIDILAAGFGWTTNLKGYRVLNGIKILWGDGINEDTCVEPFNIGIMRGFSAESFMVGSGGGLMQANIDRDTAKWAFKASAILRRGHKEWEGIAKDPITDPGKRSKAGFLHLFKSDDGYTTVASGEGSFGHTGDLLVKKFQSGFSCHNETLDDIRARIDSQL